MIDWNKPIQLVHSKAKGRVVSMEGHEYYPVIILWDGSMLPCAYTIDGISLHNSELCVENVPEEPEIVRYVNVYKRDDGVFLATGFNVSKGSALFAAKNTSYKNVARIRIEFKEGQFDE